MKRKADVKGEKKSKEALRKRKVITNELFSKAYNRLISLLGKNNIKTV